MIRANFDLKFPLQIDSQEDNLEAKIVNTKTVRYKKRNEYINIINEKLSGQFELLNSVMFIFRNVMTLTKLCISISKCLSEIKSTNYCSDSDEFLVNFF
jgi:hypothetical protein